MEDVPTSLCFIRNRVHSSKKATKASHSRKVEDDGGVCSFAPTGGGSGGWGWQGMGQGQGEGKRGGEG